MTINTANLLGFGSLDHAWLGDGTSAAFARDGEARLLANDSAQAFARVGDETSRITPAGLFARVGEA